MWLSQFKEFKMERARYGTTKNLVRWPGGSISEDFTYSAENTRIPWHPWKKRISLPRWLNSVQLTQIQDLNNKVSVLCEIVLESEYNKALLEATHLIGQRVRSGF